jgi:hypothetical protein
MTQDMTTIKGMDDPEVGRLMQRVAADGMAAHEAEVMGLAEWAARAGASPTLLARMLEPALPENVRRHALAAVVRNADALEALRARSQPRPPAERAAPSVDESAAAVA